MIFAGRLTENLKFYKIVETQGRSGFKDTTEVFKFEAMAEKMKNKENIGVDASEVFHTLILQFRLRYRPVVETDIVVYREERYRILSIDEYRLDNEMVIRISKINE